MSRRRLSAVLCVHDEERQLEECLRRLAFADEIVVVLDRCTDGSKAIAARFADRLIEAACEIEGDRRNLAIEAATGDWLLEVDADERVTEALAAEIRATVDRSTADWHRIPVDNYVGRRLVRHGWGAAFGKGSYAGLFRKGVKHWGRQRVHPRVEMNGRQGPALTARLEHLVDRNISDMLGRLDRYTTARARDLREQGVPETFGLNIRRMFARFYKCYIRRRGYREGRYGFVIALMAALYPVLSFLKATLEEE